MNATDPHQGQPVLAAGEPLGSASRAMLLLHGRGASAQDILTLVPEFDAPGCAFLAPQAAGGTWYPNRFLDPIASNEPWLSSALALVGSALGSIQTAGIPPERTILLGFSQGGCLALEYAARNAQRFGGVAGLSAALIGGPGDPRQDRGDLAGTPIFLGCSDNDFHVPQVYVRQSAETLRSLGGSVTLRLYPNLPHTINQDEIDFVQSMLASI
jgi:predicted esterase